MKPPASAVGTTILSKIQRIDFLDTVREKSQAMKSISECLDGNRHAMVPRWLELNKAKFEAIYREAPSREDIPIQANEQLIVELYSK